MTVWLRHPFIFSELDFLAGLLVTVRGENPFSNIGNTFIGAGPSTFSEELATASSESLFDDGFPSLISSSVGGGISETMLFSFSCRFRYL